MNILDLGGCDEILGVQWLRELGQVTFDYQAMCINFVREGEAISLSAVNDPPVLKSISASDQPLNLPPWLTSTLNMFSDVFEAPRCIATQRNHDHRITLKPGSEPINIRAYRYPHIQKQEIELLVEEMLKAEIIRPSSSPFASTVILVKKRDGTWCFCVDYGRLNDLTIKNRFPIPNIDELLDELHGAKLFSNWTFVQGTTRFE